MGKRPCVQDFLYFRIMHICHGLSSLSSLLWHIQLPHTLHYSLSLRFNIFHCSSKTRMPENHRITDTDGDQAHHAPQGLWRAVYRAFRPYIAGECRFLFVTVPDGKIY